MADAVEVDADPPLHPATKPSPNPSNSRPSMLLIHQWWRLRANANGRSRTPGKNASSGSRGSWRLYFRAALVCAVWMTRLTVVVLPAASVATPEDEHELCWGSGLQVNVMPCAGLA